MERKRWDEEWDETRRRLPDKEKHECCLAIVLGDLEALGCDVHVGKFDGVFRIPVEYCPYCGTELAGLREVVLRRMRKELDSMYHGELGLSGHD